MKRAIITGIKGQDGSYLQTYLMGLGYQVRGVVSEVSTTDDETIHADLSNLQSVYKLLNNFQPDEVYHLAAFHQSSEEENSVSDHAFFEKTYQVNVLSVLNLLESICRLGYGCKIFFASSSRVFGLNKEVMQNENTPMNPVCLYGMTKSLATNLCRYYRANKDVFASVGILYNHESPLRHPKFICKKIVKRAVEIKTGKTTELVVGDLEAEVDWGFAGDYVIAMHSILQLDQADDFIIATGHKHSVRQFIEETFTYLGLDWKKYVRIESAVVSRRNRCSLVGDHSKLSQRIGWKPKIGFREMIHLMVDAELNYALV